MWFVTSIRQQMFEVAIHHHSSTCQPTIRTTADSHPSRAEPNSADHWPTRLNQFSFSIPNLQNIVKILDRCYWLYFQSPYHLEIFTLQIPPISKIFQSPLYHRKRNFISMRKQFFLDRDYIWAINDKTKSVILTSIAHWFFTINYHLILLIYSCLIIVL